MNDACVMHGVPWVYTAVLGTGGMTMPILPGKGPCLRCLFPEPPSPGAIPTCAEAGILGPIPAALAAWEATAAIGILAGSPDLVPGRLVHLDPWRGTAETTLVARAPGCPSCGERRFEFLLERGRTAALCGDAVHISPRKPGALDLHDLASRLGLLGRVAVAHGVLVAELEGVELTVFPDGRAVVKGVADPARAQALYDRYVAR